MTQEKISAILAALPHLAGIYKMLGAQGEVLYVGKAKSLKNRVSSYFQKNITHPKTQALVSKICDIELIITHSETEALLLEQNLIKSLKPPYNILLKDDKSYPYLVISWSEDFPQLYWQRGKKVLKQGHRLFGPYPNSKAVLDTLLLLQKTFQLRQCDDSNFKHRDRPCMQYQIKRCRAPCVALVNQEDYRQDVLNAMRFLEGKSSELQQHIAQQMEQASLQLNFEQAAFYRDQLVALRQIQAQQSVYTEQGEADVFALLIDSGVVCMQVLYVRGGRVLGSKAYFLPTTQEQPCDIMLEFLGVFYWQQERDLPQEIIVNQVLPQDDIDTLQLAFVDSYQRKIRIKTRVREQRAAWLNFAQLNAQESIKAHIQTKLQVSARLMALQQVLQLSHMPQRIECFDISHLQGEATVASCVVYDIQGAKKRDYRHYLIKNITAGDDYAAMEQAIKQRFKQIDADSPKPDVLLIDGGKGQLERVQRTLDKVPIDWPMCLIAISKGEGRKAGLETIHFVDGRQLQLASDEIAFHLLQYIRDEAHRFAITKHRAKRDKTRQTSPLEAIPNLGAKRRRALLQHFGGLQGVINASEQELAMVSGIGLNLAQTIYAILH
ncbi:MAG: excinuclease ABC subunit UvrC [Moraxellaceae bacterium]|nr:excinuclease ABC subunit UvrC [Moraxellaceae bacterium]